MMMVTRIMMGGNSDDGGENTAQTENYEVSLNNHGVFALQSFTSNTLKNQAVL